MLKARYKYTGKNYKALCLYLSGETVPFYEAHELMNSSMETEIDFTLARKWFGPTVVQDTYVKILKAGELFAMHERINGPKDIAMLNRVIRGNGFSNYIRKMEMECKNQYSQTKT